MAQPIPQIDGLPMVALQPTLSERLFGGPKLTPRQQQLLEMFQTLDFSRKAQLLHGMKPDGIIPGRAIEQLYDEQRRLNMKQGGRFGSLRDTTESDLV